MATPLRINSSRTKAGKEGEAEVHARAVITSINPRGQGK